MEKIANRIQLQQREQERFESFEYQRRRTDEITNASERLALPMRNSFEYELKSDGELWFQGESLGEIFDRSIAIAEEITLQQPQFMTELIRRRIERQEYDEQRRLALGGDNDPDVLVVLSPLPDAVVSGADLGAYDLKRKKTLARIYERSETGITATSLSLDMSDRDGLQSIARRFNQEISDEASSEDILGMRFWGYRSELGEKSTDTVRRTYDEALTRLYGGRWYGGQRDSKVLDAMSFIESQPDLISTHLSELGRLDGQYSGRELEANQESARYNFAAALTRRLRGENDADSLSEAGDVARANGEDYKNDCPEGRAASASQSVSELGMGNKEMRCVTCPFCGHSVDAIVSGNSISCPRRDCQKSVNTKTGVVTDGRLIAKKLAATANHRTSTPPPLSKQESRRQLRQTYGADAVLRTMTVLGGVERLVINRQNGEVITKLA